MARGRVGAAALQAYHGDIGWAGADTCANDAVRTCHSESQSEPGHSRSRAENPRGCNGPSVDRYGRLIPQSYYDGRRSSDTVRAIVASLFIQFVIPAAWHEYSRRPVQVTDRSIDGQEDRDSRVDDRQHQILPVTVRAALESPLLGGRHDEPPVNARGPHDTHPAGTLRADAPARTIHPRDQSRILEGNRCLQSPTT